ncbi:unnamed protein product [Ectocarpus sp. 13 AM-2016]
MGRGRGKGKRGGRGGGGRQHFVSSLEELESRNDRDEAWAARRKAEREDSGESSGDETKKRDDDDGGSEEEGSSEDEGARGGGAAAAAAGAVEMKQPKAKGVSSLIEVANPNAKPKAGRMMKAKDMDMAAAPVELSRREREAVEAQRKKDHYMKLHAEGKTQEAQVDMARLALVRKRREEAEARKAEEAAAEGASGKAKMEKEARAKAGSGGPQKLNPLEVKKMNPTRLKELLKERDESLQGSKKDLIARLLAWEKTNQS